MTRPKAVIVVAILALVFAGIAAWLTFHYLQGEMDKTKAVQPQQIVVAAADIPIGATIGQPQLKVTSWPKDSIPPGSSLDPKPLIGRVAIRAISKGDAVTEQKLKPKAGAQGSGFMTYIIPLGHRAVTVAVNEVAGVAGFITPNDRVDVVLTTPIPGVQSEKISKIILQNVPVLATGQITEQKEGKPVVVPTVTLDLSPDDSERLVLGASRGSLQLLLRNIADTGPTDARGATIARVLSGSAPPPAATPAPAAAPKPAKVAKVAVKRPAVKKPRAEAAPRPQAPAARSSHTVTLIDGGVRTTKEFVLQ
ncbi:Flp pilus assembly protein CpaB [Geomonas nitrogeniifigens]|uniref:Flp pilus assembly protein CpaB n=1 Tax=Geomonas diazotrophica TaxID=2843197 RepID=A0ABX8JL89_9BACT|nr:Flp pilus assembly protein CpaB [Geomonas nitrogeniifigens]QWV99078.1 Flp pilus assembly protein CpaB [Geomonas nitrogeniifigens]QXE88246.1 Flp pilus assembly protein CpaB [Geomonas nitrogeniifigens]